MKIVPILLTNIRSLTPHGKGGGNKKPMDSLDWTVFLIAIAIIGIVIFLAWWIQRKSKGAKTELAKRRKKELYWKKRNKGRQPRKSRFTIKKVYKNRKK